MRVLYWLKDHWYFPLFVIGVVLGWWWTRKSGRMPPVERIAHELRAIAAGREARELRAKLGTHEAAEQVRRQHAQAVQKLNDEQAKKAEELRDDPVALSRFLVRASR